MERICILAFLGINSWKDIRTREVSLLSIVVFGIVGMIRACFLGNSGFYESKNLKLQVSEGKKVQVTYDLDMFSLYGGFNSHLQVKGSVKVIKPVTWIRKVKGLSEVSNKLKG